MAGSAELHEPAVVHHAFDDGRRELVVGEERAPPADLDVRGDYHVPPLIAVRDLVQEPRRAVISASGTPRRPCGRARGPSSRGGA